MTINRIRITGETARQIRRTVTLLMRPSSMWDEVRMMDACGYGCKLHVRSHAGVLEFAVLHNSTYGCQLGRDETTAIVPVSVEDSTDNGETDSYESQAAERFDADNAAMDAGNRWGQDPDYLLAAGRY